MVSASFRMKSVLQHVADLRGSKAYRHYEKVRAEILALKEVERAQAGGVARPSDYWSEELANFDYMIDASPLIIAKLRHHAHHITGIRVYDYRSSMTRTQAQFEAKLKALAEVGGREIFVPESPALGGFGFKIDGELVNIDTLKFYECLIALQKGEILREFRASEPPKTVCEIGSGWGGFAYQFKTLFPKTRYVLVDFPELFLFAGPYLMTLFPDARFAFFDPAGGKADLPDADFVFVPHFGIDQWRPEHLDLTVNMASYQEMTTEQVRSYVRFAHDRGCPYVYSLNRDRSPHNAQLSNVRDIIAESYWLHEIEVLPVPYTKMLDSVKPVKPGRPTTKSADLEKNRFHHVIGWRRVK